MLYRHAWHGRSGCAFASFASLAFLALLAAGWLAASCARPPKSASLVPTYTDAPRHLHLIAVRFAPILQLNPSEPCSLLTVVAVLHPTKPLIAYHVFFDDDVMLSGRGKLADHEIVWVEYDPVSMKIADVQTLWHRTILRTDACLLDAKRGDQRPKIDVQWGQHGMLPLGWQSLEQVRPKLEMPAHFELVRFINRVPKLSPRRPAVTFGGSYAQYATFDRVVDSALYIHEGDEIVAEDPLPFLRSRLATTFTPKKDWPEQMPPGLTGLSW